MPNDLQGYLQSVPTTDNTRADAWDAYNSSTDQNDFQQRVGKLGIPDDAKADLWDAKYGNKSLGVYKAPASAAPVSRPNPSTPTAAPADAGIASRLWGWANQPANLGHLRESLKQSHAIADAPPTLKEADDQANHPLSYAADLAKRGMSGFGADAGDMLLTPLSLGMAALGPVAADAGAVGTAAKGALSAIGLGFGLHGAADVVQHPGMQPGETSDAYARRMLGNAAGVVAGAAGAAEIPHVASTVRQMRSGAPYAPSTGAPEATPMAPASTVPEPAQARLARAVGTPGPNPSNRTVYADPDFAQELDQWNKSDLQGKRVKLQTNKKGVTSMSLAHSDPNLPGFQYTNPQASSVVSFNGAEGQVPVTLGATKEGRGTRAVGHYLDVQIGDGLPQAEAAAPAEAQAPVPAAAPGLTPLQKLQQSRRSVAPATAEPVAAPLPVAASPVAATPQMPIAGPETGQGAIAEPQGALPVPGPTPTPPPASSEAAEPPQVITSAPVPATTSNPLPKEIAGAKPRYSYGPKQFQLKFQDPADLAAYTYAQDKPNKAQAKFESYLMKEFPGASADDLKRYGQTVRDTIKASAKSSNPAEGPLDIPSHRNLVDATGRLESQQPVVEPPTKGFEAVSQPAGGVKPGADEPGLSPGNTRLYHGSATPGRVEGDAWYSTNRQYAADYRQGAELQYVDYPTDKLNERFPDQSPSEGYTQNLNLSSEETGPRKVLKPVEPKPNAPVKTDLSPIEEKMRPLIGQVANLRRLQSGELASHAIDVAIHNSENAYGEIPEDVAAKVSKVLGEPVGNRLTDDQIDKLQKMRGGVITKEPVIKYYTKAQAERIRSGESIGGGKAAEEFEQRLMESQTRMLQALQDPSVPDAMKAKINEAMQPDAKGQMKYALFEPEMRYPEPKTLDPQHIEAPFGTPQVKDPTTTQALGHEITPISLKNYRAVFGNQVRDLLLSTSKSRPFVTDEEWNHLQELKRQAEAGISGGEDAPGYNPSSLIHEIVGTPGAEARGSVFQAESLKGKGSEYETYYRQLQQKVLARKLNRITEDLRRHVADWNNQRQGAPTSLTEQLEKLPPSTRKLLPQELFHEAQSDAAATSPAPETPVAKEPTQTPDTGTKAPAPAESGEEAKVGELGGDGIRMSKHELAIQTKYPESYDNAENVRDVVAQRGLPAKHQQAFYERALKVYHDGLESKDPMALKNALDMAKAPMPKPGVTLHGSAFGVDLAGKAIVDLAQKLTHPDTYTPEQLHEINYEAGSMMLDRWEAMSESELFKKKEGLWKDSLTQRIAQAEPTSTDPAIRQQQTENYNELVDRHNALKEAVGPSTNLASRLVDLFQQFADQRQLKTEARMAMRLVRGDQYRNNAILRQHFDSFDRLVNELPLPEQDRFFDAMSRGNAQNPDVFGTVDPKFLRDWEQKNGPVPHPDDVAAAVRGSFDAARDRVTDASGKLEEFIVNYMPGMYDNVARAKSFAQGWAAHRPLAGGSDFLKEKMYQFHADALKAGLTPSTSNPVRAMMMRVEQLNRFTMAHEFKNALVGRGLAEWYQSSETPPVGHEALSDAIFGQRGIGQYYAPQSVARTFNNFVSTGLTGGWKIPYTNFSLFDAIHHTNNLANRMQLGISMFHGVETMLNSGFSTMAIGLRQMTNEGKIIRGAGNFIKGSTFLAPLVEDAWNGSRGLVNFRDPTKNLQYAQMSSDLERANANAQTSGAFKLEEVDRMKKNWATATDDLIPNATRAWAGVKAGLNLLASGVEATSWPLMNKLIPAVKAGAFYRMADQIHGEYAGQSPDVINLELQKAWDSIDNRFGQVNYDNMFMNKAMKDIATLAVRSPGWNIGTIREVGGGMKDLGGSVYDAAQGKGFKISNRTAYTAAMVMGTMYVNSMYQLLKTGEMPKGMDFFFPKDGTKTTQGETNRVYPKTYVYDFINLAHDPVNTVWHKAAPDISTLSDIIRNEDYYHREIRDPGKDPIDNAASSIAYLAHQFVPFSFGNLQESKLRNQKSNWESFAGVLPAPRWVGRSEAENLANTYYQGTKGSGAMDEWQVEHQATFINLRNQFAAGKLTSDDLTKAIRDGKLSAKSVRYIMAPQTKTQLQTWTEHLSDPAQVWNVWDKATPEEKKALFPTVIKKVATQLSGDEQREKFQELQDYMNKH